MVVARASTDILSLRIFCHCGYFVTADILSLDILSIGYFVTQDILSDGYFVTQDI
jgi:hypothetical protein